MTSCLMVNLYARNSFDEGNKLYLNGKYDDALKEYSDFIKRKGMTSFSLLMGRSMSKLRGKVDGQKVNSILKHKLEQFSQSNL